jgi:hypothetical protein
MVFGKRGRKTEHQYVKDRLCAYLDGELSSRERSAVEQHLETCRACRWQLDTLRQAVQWTGELPCVSLPRTFTIPLPVQPAPAPRRRLSPVPVMQGATALVALLLVFAVAGEFMLTGFLPAVSSPAAPAPAREALQAANVPEMVTQAAVMMQEDAAGLEVTEEVQLLAEAPAPEASQAIEAELAPEAQPEMAAFSVEPTPVPAAAEEVRTAKAMTSSPPGLGGDTMGTMAGEPAGVEPETEATVASGVPPVLPTTAPEVVAVEELGVAEEPVPPLAISPAPAVASPTLAAAATVLARAEEQAALAMSQAEQAPLTPGRTTTAQWVRLAQLALGIAFLLLGSATFVLMLQRRRRSKSV